MNLHDLLTRPIFVFDVESIGLHGEPYAVGYTVIHEGEYIEGGLYAIDPSRARGDEEDRTWIGENVGPIEINADTMLYMLNNFWADWIKWKDKDAFLACDCGWPVESGFLSRCIEIDPYKRKFQGPYPFIDISNILLAADMDPMKTYDRMPDELPKHDPLMDARQSARLLWQALVKLGRQNEHRQPK